MNRLPGSLLWGDSFHEKWLRKKPIQTAKIIKAAKVRSPV
jgi:hypothetical protein